MKIKFTPYQQHYICPCRLVRAKRPISPPVPDVKILYDVCPKCGRSTDSWKKVSGRWKREFKTFLFFQKFIKEEFEEATWNK